PYKWPLQKVNTSFGQGVTVTVLQMMQGFSAIANEGKMVKPYFVDKIVDPETGEVTQMKPEYLDSPISKETANQTLDYLKSPVYSEHGTARRYQLEGYELAAKTGTAQLVNPKTGKYFAESQDHVFSVVGFAPADNPKVILYVTVQQPKWTNEVNTGSGVVEKIFNPVMKRALELYAKEESGKEASEKIKKTVPKVTGLPAEEAAEKLKKAGFDVQFIGTGDRAVQQLPLPETVYAEGQRVLLLTNGASTMPDMTGWSKNDVLKVAEITGIPIKVDGEGFVRS